MRVWDALLAFPGILTGIAVVTVLGPGALNVAIALAIVNVPEFSRLTRACVLRERERDYILAARCLGGSDKRLISLHLVPNCLPPLLVQLSLSMGFAVLLEASLSFLGLGTQAPDPSWGSMLNDSRTFLRQAPWYGVFPGVALAILLIGLNYLSDALRWRWTRAGSTRRDRLSGRHRHGVPWGPSAPRDSVVRRGSGAAFGVRRAARRTEGCHGIVRASAHLASDGDPACSWRGGDIPVGGLLAGCAAAIQASQSKPAESKPAEAAKPAQQAPAAPTATQPVAAAAKPGEGSAPKPPRPPSPPRRQASRRCQASRDPRRAASW